MTRAVLGIDIAKAKFDGCLLLPDNTIHCKVFPHTPHGFDLLTRWLGPHTTQSVHACLEATGTYGAALARLLYDQQSVVSLIHPAAIKAFAASRLTRSKTERVDAQFIARFCATQTPEPGHLRRRTPRSELRSLVSNRYRSLK